MTSKTAISNQAISHLGNAVEIGNVETENSAEAGACRRFYDDAVEATLRDAPWPFATRFDTLGLVEEDPTDEWEYAYRYPSDCVNLRRIQSGLRRDTRQSRVEYKLGSDDNGQLIYTDLADAKVEFTARVTDPAFFPVDFRLALSFRLAMYIAPRITGGDPYNLQSRCESAYKMEIAKAWAAAAMEEQPPEEPDSEFGRFRE